MLDGGPSVQLQRTHGTAAVAVSVRDGRIQLDRLKQSGSAKCLLPRVHRAVPQAVFLNTSGGITGGDQIEFGAQVGADASLIATTQTAERAYQSVTGSGHVDVTLDVGENANLVWVPQETILFDQANLDRKTRVNLAPGASLFMLESLVFGRCAMGETLVSVSCKDTRQVDGPNGPIWRDRLHISDQTVQDAGHPFGLANAGAIATVYAFGPAYQNLKVQCTDGVRLSKSAWTGQTVVRMMSPRAHALRNALVSLLAENLPEGVPRVWQI
ncbi:MAG: urease accessory protein UreD [Pseudomonadota bacterium]